MRKLIYLICLVLLSYSAYSQNPWTPYATSTALRTGSVGTPDAVILTDKQGYTFRYDSTNTMADDSAMVIRLGNRRYVRVGVSDPWTPYTTSTDLRNGVVGAPDAVILTDKQGDVFRYNPANTRADDDAMVIRVAGRTYERATDRVTLEMFGGKANDNVSDVTALRKAITYIQTYPSYYNYGNSTPRGPGQIELGVGVYVVDETVNLWYLNGFVLSGKGKESTVLLYTGTGSMFDCKQLLHDTFREMQISAGQITTDNLGNKNITLTDTATTASVAFNWAVDGGGDRFNVFENIKVSGGFDKFMYLGGTNTHSELTFQNVDAFMVNTFLHVNNSQAINIYANQCNFELINKDAFYFQQGGFLFVNGANVISPGTFLRINDPFGSGVGQNTQMFSLSGVKFEGYQNIDPSRKPKLFDITTVGVATVILDKCNNLAATDATSIIGSLNGSATLKMVDSQIAGTVTTVPLASTTPAIHLINCKTTPTFLHTAIFGGRYMVIRQSDGYSDSGVDALGRHLTSQSIPAMRLMSKIEANFPSTANYDMDIDFPSDVVIENIVLMSRLSGAFATAITLYSDAARSKQIATITTSTATSARLNRITPPYSDAPLTDMKTSGGKLYARVTPGGNIGISTFVLFLDVVNVEKSSAFN